MVRYDVGYRYDDEEMREQHTSSTTSEYRMIKLLGTIIQDNDVGDVWRG